MVADAEAGGGGNVDVLMRGGCVKDAGDSGTRRRDTAGPGAIAGLRLRLVMAPYGL